MQSLLIWRSENKRKSNQWVIHFVCSRIHQVQWNQSMTNGMEWKLCAMSSVCSVKHPVFLHTGTPQQGKIATLNCCTSKSLLLFFSLNCYQFAIVAFSAIEEFRSNVRHNLSTFHKQFKQLSFLGVKLASNEEVYKDIIRVIVLFFEQKLRYLELSTRKDFGQERQGLGQCS